MRNVSETAYLKLGVIVLSPCYWRKSNSSHLWPKYMHHNFFFGIIIIIIIFFFFFFFFLGGGAPIKCQKKNPCPGRGTPRPRPSPARSLRARPQFSPQIIFGDMETYDWYNHMPLCIICLKPWSQIPLRTPYERFFDHYIKWSKIVRTTFIRIFVTKA